MNTTRSDLFKKRFHVIITIPPNVIFSFHLQFFYFIFSIQETKVPLYCTLQHENTISFR